MIVLTDGPAVFGEGATEEAAIADAVANCLPQTNNRTDQLEAVTTDWCRARLAEGVLYFYARED